MVLPYHNCSVRLWVVERWNRNSEGTCRVWKTVAFSILLPSFCSNYQDSSLLWCPIFSTVGGSPVGKGLIFFSLHSTGDLLFVFWIWSWESIGSFRAKRKEHRLQNGGNRNYHHHRLHHRIVGMTGCRAVEGSKSENRFLIKSEKCHSLGCNSLGRNNANGVCLLLRKVDGCY